MTLEVVKNKVVLRMFTVDFAAGTFAIGETVVADLCETAVSPAADKSNGSFVLEEVADGETNAYAYVTATYDAKRNSFTLSQKDRGTRLATNGLLKLTLTDVYGWKWVCEMLPVDNGGTQFRGVATGTKRGEPTQYAPVWSNLIY